jgi:hypothetical protein
VGWKVSWPFAILSQHIWTLQLKDISKFGSWKWFPEIFYKGILNMPKHLLLQNQEHFSDLFFCKDLFKLQWIHNCHSPGFKEIPSLCKWSGRDAMIASCMCNTLTALKGRNTLSKLQTWRDFWNIFGILGTRRLITHVQCMSTWKSATELWDRFTTPLLWPYKS